MTDKVTEGIPEGKPVDLAFLDVILLKYAGFKSQYISEKIEFMSKNMGNFPVDAMKEKHTL